MTLACDPSQVSVSVRLSDKRRLDTKSRADDIPLIFDQKPAIALACTSKLYLARTGTPVVLARVVRFDPFVGRTLTLPGSNT